VGALDGRLFRTRAVVFIVPVLATGAGQRDPSAWCRASLTGTPKARYESSMEIPRFSAGATPEQIGNAIAEMGCAVVERLVSPSVFERVSSELAPYLEATAFGPDEFAGRHTRRTGGLIARSPSCRDLIMHQQVLGTVGRVLAKATSYHLHLTQVIAIGPGEAAQTIHRDQWAFDFFPFPSGYDVQCNTIWAMNDFTEENGATRLIPGSNKAADRLQFKPEETVAAEMPAGSVLFYSGSLYHAGGANRSDRVRYGLNSTYAMSWLRQEENQYLSTPPEIARQLPKPLLRLMGYTRGAYALGYVDDLRDPLEVLLGEPVQDEASSFGALDAALERLRS
jgi:ectoine hydroxylase-related dioxygenase (phytanoyl-CoA dioxygenase family)